MRNFYGNDFEECTKKYFSDISSYKTLTKVEEHKLCKRFKKYNDLVARNELINSNLRFVIDVAKHYKGKGLPFSELVAEGNMGLIRAIDKFDYNKDVKIISYGVWEINRSIKEAIERKNMLPSDELPKEAESQKIYEDSEEYSNNKEETEDSFINDESYKLENSQIKTIEKLLKHLSIREKEIMKAYYGINDNGNDMTLEEIGTKYNLTKERIRQIKEKSLLKLRSYALIEKSNNEISE